MDGGSAASRNDAKVSLGHGAGEQSAESSESLHVGCVWLFVYECKKMVLCGYGKKVPNELLYLLSDDEPQNEVWRIVMIFM